MFIMRADVLQPTQEHIFGFVWSGLDVKECKDKGLGVFATSSLKPGLMIPILGKRKKTNGWIDTWLALLWFS